MFELKERYKAKTKGVAYDIMTNIMPKSQKVKYREKKKRDFGDKSGAGILVQLPG